MRLQRIAFNRLCQTFVLARFFSISGFVDEKEANCVGQLNELFCFDRSSLLTLLALTRDEQYLLVVYSSLSSERTIETENNFEYSSPRGYM